jgi:putative ABC transport system substrate-binding protein
MHPVGRLMNAKHPKSQTAADPAGSRPRVDRVRRRELVLALGGTMLSSRTPRAERRTIPVIGLLHEMAPGPAALYLAAFQQGLREAGYVDGQNLAIEYHWAEGHYDRLAALARDFVDRKVDVIAAIGGTASGRAAMTTTSTIPIVIISGDPLGAGLIADLAHPGGNVTGISIMTLALTSKLLELIFELVPGAERMALLVNQNNRSVDRMIQQTQAAAATKRVQLDILKAGTEGEIDAAFTALDQLHAGALLVGSDPFFNSRRDQLVMLARSHAIPAIYELREFAVAGGLISYGPSLPAAYRAAGAYVGKILRGANPADLPVEQPTQFEMVINLTTAKALGIVIPPSILLARADEVIE